MSFQWISDPAQLADGVEQYARKALVAVHAVAGYWGNQVQTEMRERVAWEERTGAARSGLFYAVDGFGLPPLVGSVSPKARAKMDDRATVSGRSDLLVVAVGHTVFYGKFLETRFGGRYGIVMSTMQRNLPRLERLLQEIFRG